MDLLNMMTNREPQRADAGRRVANRLRKEFESLYDPEVPPEASLINAVPMAFTYEEREKWRIEPYGRMQILDGDVTLHACPKARKTESRYESHNSDNLNAVLKMVTGAKPYWDFSPIKSHTEKYPGEKWNERLYEEQLLKKLYGLEGELILVDPKPLTIYLSRSYAPRVTIVVAPEFASSYVPYAEENNIPARNIVHSVPDRGLAYLGTNGPHKGKRYERWISLSPSPDMLDSLYRKRTKKITDDAIEWTFDKDFRKYSCAITSQGDESYVNPSTVDRWLGVTGRYFLCNTTETAWYSNQWVTQASSPVFWLNYTNEDVWEEEELGEVFIVSKSYVWDKKGSQPYFSKLPAMSAYASETHRKPVVLSTSVGTHPVGLDSCSPSWEKIWKMDNVMSQVPLDLISCTNMGSDVDRVIVIVHYREGYSKVKAYPFLGYKYVYYSRLKAQLGMDKPLYKMMVLGSWKDLHSLFFLFVSFLYDSKACDVLRLVNGEKKLSVTIDEKRYIEGVTQGLIMSDSSAEDVSYTYPSVIEVSRAVGSPFTTILAALKDSYIMVPDVVARAISCSDQDLDSLECLAHFHPPLAFPHAVAFPIAHFHIGTFRYEDLKFVSQAGLSFSEVVPYILCYQNFIVSQVGEGWRVDLPRI